jgi:putative component of membrane protein insertase Oxa1/YidC/SpoIIIJ protein YidD
MSRFAIRFIHTYQLHVSGRLRTGCADAESCSDYGIRMFEQHRFPLASAQTLIRIARCRPPRPLTPRRVRQRTGGLRRLAATLGLVGILMLMGSLFSGPALAEVFGGCSGDANGTSFASIYRTTPIRVNLSQTISMRGAAPFSARAYLVRLYYFGIRYGMRGGPTTNNQWSGSATSSQFLTRGTGNYIVQGIVYGRGGPQSRKVCLANIYIKVAGDPLSEPLGQAAGGVTLTGLVGMVATAVTGGKTPPGFEPAHPEDEERLKEKEEEEAKKEEQRKKEEEENKKLAEEAEKKCFFLILPALLLTTGMMAAGGGEGTLVATRGPRVRWRPRLSVIGIGSGILFAVGSAVLLQQYGVIWPTLGMGIGFLVGGIVLGIMVPTLTRLRVVRKLNRRFATIASSGSPQTLSEPGQAPDEDLAAEGTDIPADWYPDPSGEARLRYWDGTEWTSHTAD